MNFLCRATEREEQTTITTVRGTLVLPSYSLEAVLCRATIVLILAENIIAKGTRQKLLYSRA